MAEKLTKDLNIIQNSGIEITVDPMTSDLNIIQKLDDEPNDVGGLSAAELKAKFDEAGNIIKGYINDSLIPQVLSEGITEAQREQNEAEREQNEAQRQSAEDIRSMNELQRNRNDDAREDAETARQTAETARESAEAARVLAEKNREAGEERRIQTEYQMGYVTGQAEFNESRRQKAETQRQTAETQRQTAETQRQADQAAFFQGVSAQAVTLEPGAEATAQAAPEGGSFKLTIGVPQGTQGPKGDTGAGLEVLGLYGTLAALKAAHPAGSAGEAYAVGTAEENVIYVWGVDVGDWVSIGALRGPKGDDGDSIVPTPTINEYDPQILFIAKNTSEPVWNGLPHIITTGGSLGVDAVIFHAGKFYLQNALIPYGDGETGQVFTKTITGADWADLPTSQPVWSTTPQKIGTWIDGRDYFRQVITGTSPELNILEKGTWGPLGTTFFTNPIDPDTAKVDATIGNDTKYVLPFNQVILNSRKVNVQVSVRKNGISLYGLLDESSTDTQIVVQPTPYTIIIEYALSTT